MHGRTDLITFLKFVLALLLVEHLLDFIFSATCALHAFANKGTASPYTPEDTSITKHNDVLLINKKTKSQAANIFSFEITPSSREFTTDHDRSRLRDL